ncbi:hypothetical protein L596_023829 [Steinernema carpocapsae]|uniref:Uncharacterized protein n=1 Tax=Steinernema carpocapsae TaxID=34508 RepID=A0A4U5MFL3_STECR|nr:hypothetical protein L596_023829 [Steinernema carpocapsae]
MRLSAVRLMQKFIQNKDYIFKDPKWARKDFLKTAAVLVGSQVLIGVLIEEFGYPTPDIVYDLRMYGSPDFAAYAQGGEYALYDPLVTSAIRSFKVTEGRVQASRARATPNPFNDAT